MSQAEFTEWMLKEGFMLDGVEIGATPTRGGGRGLLATRDLPAKHRLFTVPASAALTTRTCTHAPEIAAAGLTGWTALAVALTLETALGAKSRWKPYLDMLPATLDLPMFWSDDELRMLAGTGVDLRAGKAGIRDVFYRRVAPFYKRRFPHTPAHLTTLAAFTRFGGIIAAYSFTVSTETAMLPMADMLNATSGGTNAHVYYGAHKTLTMETTAPIPRGAEVLNTYGPRPNTELLLRYGYIDRPYTHDASALTRGELLAHSSGTSLSAPRIALALRARGVWSAERRAAPFIVRGALLPFGRCAGVEGALGALRARARALDQAEDAGGGGRAGIARALRAVEAVRVADAIQKCESV